MRDALLEVNRSSEHGADERKDEEEEREGRHRCGRVVRVAVVEGVGIVRRGKEGRGGEEWSDGG